MNRRKFLGLSTGTTILVAALFSIGAIFVGANGLIPLSVFATFASLYAGTIGVAELARMKSSKNVITVVGISALTFSLLIPVFTWTASANIPLSAVSVMALIPAMSWAATWAFSQARGNQRNVIA